MLAFSFEKSLSRVFLMLWTVIFYIDESLDWNRPSRAVIALFCCLASALIKEDRIAWLASLIPATLTFLYDTPFLANHLLMMLLANLFFLFLLWQKRLDDFAWVSRVLLTFLCAVYFWATLHKVNWDFLNPEVSCANHLLGNFFRRFLGPDAVDFKSEFFFLPPVILVVEFLLVLLLFVPRTFLVGATLSILFHGFLAPIRFVHFATLPLVIFFLTWLTRKDLPASEKKYWLWGAQAYFWLQIVAGLGGLLKFVMPVGLGVMTAQVIPWLVVAAMMLYRLWWISITERSFVLQRNPRLGWGWLLPGIALVLGTSNYLGLGTFNSFSMFSNLRTEGPFWNHVLIPKAVRVFPYQDQIYFVHRISTPYVKTLGEHPTPDQALTTLEVYRLYDIWRTMVPLPQIFELTVPGSSARSAYEILNPEMRPFSYWEMKLLYFRTIQLAGPNKCRW